MTLRVVLLACALVACGPGAAPPSVPHVHLGRAVPDFRRVDLTGAGVDTRALRGKVLVVKFVALYCEPCKKTLPEVERVHRDLDDVRFVGVDEDERRDDAVELARTLGVTFPMVHDEGNVLSGRFRVRDLPVTFVIDRAGVVRWVGDASASVGDLRAAIAEASADQKRP